VNPLLTYRRDNSRTRRRLGYTCLAHIRPEGRSTAEGPKDLLRRSSGRTGSPRTGCCSRPNSPCSP
jgi:hypothetical protein